MKHKFKEYNPLNEKEISELWERATLVLDTNVLLNLYRYSNETSNQFLKTIESLKDRIWIPYQVGLEYHNNRLKVISDQKKAYSDFISDFEKLILTIQNKQRNPFLSVDLLDQLLNVYDKTSKELKGKLEEFEVFLRKDSILESLNEILDNSIGEELREDELKKIQTEGENRYKLKIPPGYKDNNKNPENKFGDLIIWKSIINHAKSKELDIIFVLDDKKEDWWYEHQGKTISPRPELLKEFHALTNRICHFYQPFQFLEFSNNYLNENIPNEIIEEVKLNVPPVEKGEYGGYIQYVIKVKGDDSNVSSFVDNIRFSGYNVYAEKYLDYYNIHIFLANIPDLSRRFTEKYIDTIDRYNIVLIQKEVHD